MHVKSWFPLELAFLLALAVAPVSSSLEQQPFISLNNLWLGRIRESRSPVLLAVPVGGAQRPPVCLQSWCCLSPGAQLQLRAVLWSLPTKPLACALGLCLHADSKNQAQRGSKVETLLLCMNPKEVARHRCPGTAVLGLQPYRGQKCG